MILVDIETARNPSVPVPDPGPPPSNYKDQAKIDAWLQEKRVKLERSMSLSPLTGRVVCIAAAVELEETKVFINASESKLFDDFTVWLKGLDLSREAMTLGQHALCAYNGLSFDFPFLSTRAAVLGNRYIGSRFACRRSGDRYHVDPYSRDIGGTLGAFAAAFGHYHPSPDGGAQVQGWWDALSWGMIEAHVKDDIAALKAIAIPLRDAGVISPMR